MSYDKTVFLLYKPLYFDVQRTASVIFIDHILVVLSYRKYSKTVTTTTTCSRALLFAVGRYRSDLQLTGHGCCKTSHGVAVPNVFSPIVKFKNGL